jgi:hypothetical protein
MEQLVELMPNEEEVSGEEQETVQSTDVMPALPAQT